jgi:hypothetical protein
MRKRNLQKAVILLVCFAFLGLSASGLSAATTSQKATQLSFSLLINRPSLFLVSLFPGLRKILNVDDPNQIQPPSSSSVKTVKPAGTIKSIRLNGGD